MSGAKCKWWREIYLYGQKIGLVLSRIQAGVPVGRHFIKERLPTSCLPTLFN